MAIWRFQVTTRSDQVDPLGIQTYRTLRDFGIRSVMSVQTSRLFLVDLNEAHSVNRIANELLVDSVVEECSIIGENEMIPQSEESMVVETFFKPGVMDNVGNSIEIALQEMGIFTTSARNGYIHDWCSHWSSL